eukprot:3626788-Rhodomonas_salina.1
MAPYRPSAGYAMSGTDLAYGAICLRPCYAMSGTDLAYRATRFRTTGPYARATASPVLSSGMGLPGTTRCLPRRAYVLRASVRSPYAMSGTDILYAATFCAMVPLPTPQNPTHESAFQYKLYQECVSAVSGTDVLYATTFYAMPGTGRLSPTPSPAISYGHGRYYLASRKKVLSTSRARNSPSRCTCVPFSREPSERKKEEHTGAKVATRDFDLRELLISPQTFRVKFGSLRCLSLSAFGETRSTFARSLGRARRRCGADLR